MRYTLNSTLINEDENTAILSNAECRAKLDESGYNFLLWLVRDNLTDEEVINKFHIEKGIAIDEARIMFNEYLYPLLRNNLIKAENKDADCRHELNIKSVLLEIIDSCNFRCPHCYKADGEFNRIPLEKVVELAIELKQCGCNRITLTGGEIFTHPEFCEIYEALYNLNFGISLNTNVSCLNNKILELLKKKQPLSVEISLYGYNKESYEHFTLDKNGFEKVVNAIKLLKENDVNVSLKCVITNKNYDFFDKIKDFAKNLGCKFRSDFISFPRVGGGHKANPEQISVEKTIEYLKSFSGVERHYVQMYNNSLLTEKSNKIFRCKKGDDTLFISSKLNVCMCICMQHVENYYKTGNLRECVKNLRKFLTFEQKKEAKCADCKYISVCRYCPAKFYSQNGDYENPPEWFCQLGKSIYDEFIDGFKMFEFRELKPNEKKQMFDIISNNMKSINMPVSEDDYSIWAKSLDESLKNPDNRLYLSFYNGLLVGYVQIILHGSDAFISEVELLKKYQGSRLLLRIIRWLVACKDVEKVNCVSFRINKHNLKSINTFQHLGAKKVGETERAIKFEIMREDVTKYLNNL